ncbi:ATP-binding cassette domain-containing protein [Aureitalea sp. L0-47]|uniref:ABC transporter ATP-binding protein n=1 Tax=Aureitalea sp. L0-47 TaxID=2816962 RepID=UPI002238E1E6|nr:polysaccharide ABC transporter ATP-binding protein [Aureitalea sp. L0-47]MCW5519198.1 ATP-binding cassette domain-containing protein [Aureitalea sp. L0-47]
MGKVILKAENISKQYRLGLVGTGSLMHDLNRFWHRIRGKEDPYLKIGSVNDRSSKATEDYVWALKDINFEVEEGEVLGIIGKNGAGKSTLLKLLSRVTSPTTGIIKSKGRIASLLEVGTGFHPELTGRENIYLNGAILGMTKAEIASKIDEIVAFSGCEMYIDTPTKRYSSGMTVRLAFAVAAHLEPDILVVDEVLAVGDAEFQKKAIGKMQEISGGDGRTVLFVSHNMASVSSLCSRAILLENGCISYSGSTEQAIDRYLKDSIRSTDVNHELFPIINHDFAVSFDAIKLIQKSENIIQIELSVQTLNDLNEIGFGFRIKDIHDVYIASFTPGLTGITVDLPKGKSTISLEIENFIDVVSGGQYYIDVWLAKPKLQMIIFVEKAIGYYILPKDWYGTGMEYDRNRHGLIKINANLSID